MKKLLAIIVLGLLWSGNANSTISIGSEKLVIITEQPGAHCVLTNNKGSWTVLTPGIVKVKRSKKQLKIICNKDGYKKSVTNYKLRNSSAVDSKYVASSISGAVGSAIGSGNVSGAVAESLLAGKEIMSSKLGTYATSFGHDRNKKQPTIFIALTKIK